MGKLTALLLQRHTIILFAFIFMCGALGSLYVVQQEKERLVEINAQHFAEDVSLFFREFRTLYSSEVTAKVNSHAVEVRHDYEQVDGAIPLPVTLMMKFVEGISETKTLESVRLYSDFPFPWRKSLSQDDFGRDALAALTLKPKTSFIRVEENNGQKRLRFATADVATAACISCHNSYPDSAKTDWAIGDVLGVLEVNVSLDDEEVLVTESLNGMFYVVGIIILSTVLGLILIGLRLRGYAEFLEQEVEARGEEFRQSQKMEAIGALVGGIAHDFNNILAAISGAVFLAERNPKSHNKQLNTIKTQADRAAEIVKQLLAFARKDIRKLEKLSLPDLVQQSERLFKLTTSEDIQFNINISKRELSVKGDQTQLQQVIINLVNNSKDALEGVSAPVISVSILAKELPDNMRSKHLNSHFSCYACISVSDNGHGISEEHLQDIFEPFFTKKEVGKGTGLGLAMVKGTVESHGGAIDVESTLGEGTTFNIYLPLTDTDTDTTMVHGTGECILLVDDEMILREVNRELLEELGYQIIEASDGLQAVEQFKSNQELVKLIVMDVVMPRMGGIAAAKRIRELSGEVPIIFATGYDRSQVLGGEEAEMPNTAIITKPFVINELHKLINEMVL